MTALGAATCAAIVATVAAVGTAAAQRDDTEAERTAELELIAATVWQAVVARDVETLLRYSSPLDDAVLLRSRLTRETSALACALWETACLQHQLRGQESLVRSAVIDFFRKHPRARLRVAYIGMPGALGMESRLDLAIVTWVVPGSDADRNFPAHDLKRWGVDHVNTCMIHDRRTGWRFYSDVGVFFCPNSLSLIQSAHSVFWRFRMRLHLRNARLIDGTGAHPIDNASLIIERDTIVHAGRLAKGDEPTGDVQVMDVGGKTVIPGLIEAHLHLSYNNVKAIADLDLNCPPEYSTLVSAKNAELALRCGYTAARSAGSVHAVDVALKRAINEGLYPGPRLLAAGRDICATGGMADWNPSYLKLGMEGLALIADGPEQIRAAVRRVIKDGADVVKCYVGGDALLPHTPIGDCTYTLEEVRALVDEAHMRGRMVSAHVRGERSSEVAARAGVDSIEHATYANDETLKCIRDVGLTLVPGLRYLYSIIENGPRFGITDEVIAPTGLRDEIKQAADTYRRAKDLGIRMCPGGDFGFAWNPHGEYAKDIQVFVDVIGFSPLEAITCATKNGAELMRMADRIGTLQPGKLADLVIVDGDPLRDIAVLQDRARLTVMKGGVFVTAS